MPRRAPPKEFLEAGKRRLAGDTARSATTSEVKDLKRQALDLKEGGRASHLPVRRTLDKLGILPGSFYRWYDRYRTGGLEALEDKPSKPTRAWNRIPDDVRRHHHGHGHR